MAGSLPGMTGFESRAHEQAFWSGLKRRVIPHKFAYTGCAAITHCRLAREASYRHIAGSAPFEAAFAGKILKGTWANSQSLSVCDIGPGNGAHTSLFLGCLSAEFSGFVPQRYVGLDFSEFLLQIAAARVEARFPELAIELISWDLDAGPCGELASWRFGTGPILALLLGQTLGNVTAPECALSNIRRSLASGDVLALSVALVGGRTAEEMVAEYDNRAFQIAMVEPLHMADLGAEVGRLKMLYDEAASAVRGFYVFERDAQLEFNGETLRFVVGDEIDCFLSRRFTLESITGLASSAGFEVAGYSENRARDGAMLVLRNP